MEVEDLRRQDSQYKNSMIKIKQMRYNKFSEKSRINKMHRKYFEFRGNQK